MKMKEAPKIKDLMSRAPITVPASATVMRAKQLMLKHSVRHLPVVAEGKLVGIITDRNLKRTQAVTTDDKFDHNCVVGDICLRHVSIVQSSERADKVLAYMASERIGSALDTGNGKLVGIFTVTDACSSFSEFLRSRFPNS